MIDISNLVYSNGSYFIIKTNKSHNRPYKVVSSDYKLHTHLRNKKEAIDIANYAKYNKIPLGADIDYLLSLSRLVRDEITKNKIMDLINTKNKHYVDIKR